jgi:hypothetical protein
LKTRLLIIISIVLTFAICCTIEDCSRFDYGTLNATFYNENKEPLENYKVYVFPFLWEDGNFRKDFDSIDQVVTEYGAEVIVTDTNGNIVLELVYSDGASSCDAPSENFNSKFGSIVFYYTCNSGEINYLQINRKNGLKFTNNINTIDSVFIKAVCLWKS